MESEQLTELALNARLNHWPPHLGVKTDAEKIGYMASALEDAATTRLNFQDLEDEKNNLLDDVQRLENEVEDLNDRVKELAGDKEMLELKNRQLEEDLKQAKTQ